MKKNISISIRLTFIMILLCAIVYPLLIAAVGKLSPGEGKGVTILHHGKVVGYEKIGQQFKEDRYFQGRPSAVDYNAGGSGGSNKGPSNPDYLQVITERIDSFMAHNPGISKTDIPAELVTASGSGLDPDISPAAAMVQVKRVAVVRHLQEATVQRLVEEHVNKPFAGLFGRETINVLKLNIALDVLEEQRRIR